MKVAILSLHFGEYAMNLAHALEMGGHEIHLVGRRDNLITELGDDADSFYMSSREAVDHQPLRNPLVLGLTRRIVNSVKRFSPDVIHVQETLQDYLIGALPFLERLAPIVLTVHDHISHSGIDSRMGWRRQIYRRILRGAAKGVIVHGEKLSEEIQLIDNRLRGKVWVVPHGVLGPPAKVNQEWNPGQLLFFGRVEAYKGLSVLISAVRVLREKRIPVKVVVAGRGTDLENHRGEIENDPSFVLLDRYVDRNEIPRLFSASNIVVLPYVDGTQSGVAALAANYGRPVIATQVGSIPEMVRHDESGVLVPPMNPVALAEAIERVVCDPAYGRFLGENARRRAENDLSWQCVANKTGEVYRQVISRCR